MGLVLLGLNHRSAPLEVRERLTFPTEGLADALHRLTGLPPFREGMILSTCNRTELLAHAEGGGAQEGAEAMKRFLAEERSFPAQELDRYCYRMVGRDAVHHLFRVTSSLDSMVLGETQILGQVKGAYQAAQQAGSIGAVLDPLLRRALGVAKKVRTETGISRRPLSVSSAAVSLARTIFEDLRDRKVMLLGAGKMGELAARALVERELASLIITNRSYPRALELAQSFGGQAAPYEQLLETLEQVDIVIASTSAVEPVLGYEDVARLIRARRNRPIFFVDIAVPRDIDPRVNTIDNVYLYDLDDLAGVVSAGRAEREEEAKRAEELVRKEVDSFEVWVRHQDLSPLIVEAKERMDRLRVSELTRYRSRLSGLSEEQWRLVEELTGGLLKKVLHRPIRALKSSARHPEGTQRARFFREIFSGEDPSEPSESPQETAPVGKEGEDDPSDPS
ncbi:MAG TPA: glutamyl-tRNA reductase [Candidatus Polarisedimenticolia bacterium]|nr:glutamyl-tRNA reductase [Candidatus Polarisedimenticolia bacterium]